MLVLRFVTASTIDEKIVDRAATKRKLEKMIMKNGKFKSVSYGSKKEIMDDLTPAELLEMLQHRDHSKIIKASNAGGSKCYQFFFIN